MGYQLSAISYQLSALSYPLSPEVGLAVRIGRKADIPASKVSFGG
jgi:hypothetical protein